MGDSLSITKDIGEYYIYLKDNWNLIAKGYEKVLIKRVAIETTKDIWMGYIYQWKVYTKYGQSWLRDSIQNEYEEKRVWKIKSIRLRFLMLKTSVKCLHKSFG